MLRRLLHRSTYTDERGFTMIAALVVLFVGSLLLTATYLSANGDIKLTRTSLNSKKAYYAALAGIANFEYHLNNNSEYEKTCPVVKEAKVPQSTTESKSEPTVETYSYQVVPASESAYSVCTKNVSLSMIESNKRATGTFRVISTGTAGTKAKPGYQTRSVVATFTHEGFTHWVYYTNYEDLDPSFYSPSKMNCAQHYEEREKEAKELKITSECLAIEFVTGDSLNGPVHTNDAADICGEPVFGREGHEDKIEIGQGTYSTGSCSDKPKYKGKEEKGKEITPPATDAELAGAASSEYHFYGKTLITLNANTAKPEEANTITVTNNNETKTLPWPVSGVLYVSNSSGGCGYTYTPFGSTYTTDEGCGNAYVHGTYTKSLTIGTENDIVINGNIQTQTNSEGKPEGNATLGLIATNYIRVYHPIKQGYTPTTVKPASETAINGKCVSVKELSARIHKSTEVSEINTTGLEKGDEVEGAGIEAGTTISEVKTNSIKLSKAAKASAKELGGTITRSTEVTGITTTGLAVGDEVEGTVSGQIESGTTITAINAAGKTITLSKATKLAVTKELSANTKSGSTEVKEITTTGLVVGEEVEGSWIPAGTTISSIKESEKKITLSNSAEKTLTGTKLKFYAATATKLKFYGETIKLKVFVPTGYEYNSGLNECHKVESGYAEYRESENLYVAKCESGSTYVISEIFCKYEINSKGCSTKSTNLSATEDPNKWGSLENPIIDAAILTTAHSFIVDNYACGKQLGELTIWGSIAQDFRGTVGTGTGSTGYLKNYNYDERLATQEPPDFLSPTQVTWSITRETQPPSECTAEKPSSCK